MALLRIGLLLLSSQEAHQNAALMFLSGTGTVVRLYKVAVVICWHGIYPSIILKEFLCVTCLMMCWYHLGVIVPERSVELRVKASQYGNRAELSLDVHWWRNCMLDHMILGKELAYKEGLLWNNEKIGVCSTLREAWRVWLEKYLVERRKEEQKRYSQFSCFLC